MNHKLNRTLTAFLIVILTLGNFAGCSGDTIGKAQKDYSNIVENSNIFIPRYESHEFKEGKMKQSVKFYNTIGEYKLL